MPITDAKDPASWQIGFEDGIKFSMKLRAADLAKEFCAHFWIKHDEDYLICVECSIRKRIVS